MGVTTGFLSGVTLTTTIVYLSLAVHNQTRLRQAALLQQQRLLINGITEPQPLQLQPQTREVRAGLVETAKDMWNAELEREVRILQNVNWNQVWNRFEDGILALSRSAFQKGKEVVDEVSKK